MSTPSYGDTVVSLKRNLLFWLSRGNLECIQEMGTLGRESPFWKCMKETIWRIRLKSLSDRGIIFVNRMKEKMGDHIVSATEFVWWRKASACPHTPHFLCISLAWRKRSMKFLWQRRTDIAPSSGSQDLMDFVKWEEKNTRDSIISHFFGEGIFLSQIEYPLFFNIYLRVIYWCNGQIITGLCRIKPAT